MTEVQLSETTVVDNEKGRWLQKRGVAMDGDLWWWLRGCFPGATVSGQPLFQIDILSPGTGVSASGHCPPFQCYSYCGHLKGGQ